MTTEHVKPGDESAQSVEIPKESSPVADNQAGDLRASFGTKVDGTLSGKEKIDLGIDWDSLDKKSIFASMKMFDDAEKTLPKITGKRGHGIYLIHTAALNTRTEEKIILRVLKVISPNYHELQIEIARPSISDDHEVASFDFLQLKHDEFPTEVEDGCEEWDMKHRQTQEPYKTQGIAGKVIELTEEILKKRSANNNLAQSISAKSGQRDLTAWLEKRDFQADTPQDVAMLKRLKDRDSDLQEVTMFGETYTFDAKEFKSKFPELSGPEDPAVWDDENRKELFFYMKSCFKIKLKKSV